MRTLTSFIGGQAVAGARGRFDVRFSTRRKIVAQRWPRNGSPVDQSFVVPTMRR